MILLYKPKIPCKDSVQEPWPAIKLVVGPNKGTHSPVYLKPNMNMNMNMDAHMTFNLNMNFQPGHELQPETDPEGSLFSLFQPAL